MEAILLEAGYFLVISYTFSFSKCHQVDFGASYDSIVSLWKYLKAQGTEQDEKSYMTQPTEEK